MPSLTEPFLAVLLVLVSCASLLCDCLVIHVIRVAPRMRSTVNRLVQNMAGADVVMVLVILPKFINVIFNNGMWAVEYWIAKVCCILSNMVVTQAKFVSMTTLLAMATDRYFAVRRPLRYRVLSHIFIKCSLIGSWVYSLLSLYCIFGYDIISDGRGNQRCSVHPDRRTLKASFNFFTFWSNLFAMATLYFLTGYHLWTRKPPGEHDRRRVEAVVRSAVHVTKMSLAILAIFLCSWGGTVVSAIALLDNSQVMDREKTRVLVVSVYILIQSNGFFNFLVYLRYLKGFRSHVVRLLTIRRRIQVHPMSRAL
ncbi:predicted protein [Nematostella vectensis]|uniref:G-protein coupled receptors family 1 profile domain-containing protein n=1 Tax=Nematostella vectensis TaxID=45351 RepID=A7SI80_NEMVE|nr:RYamide receptor [Nematostella vectensis]XP_048576495.1 RYamide receptor [Nematostella vectensis]EDO36586.1 predicted protein [Nematostella vectensis]|eukprot:XP_001628649.1 predicted protein [Nematostella vectensis]